MKYMEFTKALEEFAQRIFFLKCESLKLQFFLFTENIYMYLLRVKSGKNIKEMKTSAVEIVSQ